MSKHQYSEKSRKSIHEQKCVDSIYEFVRLMLRMNEAKRICHDEHVLDKLEAILGQLNFLFKHSKGIHKLMEYFTDDELVGIFVAALEYSYDYISSVFQVLSGNKLTKKEKSKVLNRGATVYTFLLTFVQLIWCLTNFSTKFRCLFHSHKGSKCLFLYISSRNFLEFVLHKNIFSESKEKNEEFMLIDALIGSLHNLSKSVKFDDEPNATKILLDFAHEKQTDKGHLMQIYMTLANTLTDKEIGELQDISAIIIKLLEIIATAVDKITEKSKDLKRVKIDLNNGRIEYVCQVRDEYGNHWDLTEIIRALYRIAVNDKIKDFIYNECQTKIYIDELVMHGNLIEKEYAIRLLYQLSFDKNVASLIRDDKKLVDSIRELLIKYDKANDPRNTKLHEYCSGVLWKIDSKETSRRTSLISPFNIDQLVNSEQEQAKPYQFMISYNSANRETCLKIKGELEKLGFKIWIDVENIHGSSLEAMALAIEESDCILICMTEKYKLSPNCRAEAEYTFNIRKYYIPLIMQQNYKPDGWLGLILGAKIFIDFSKYQFDFSMEKLKKEISQDKKKKNLQDTNAKNSWKKIEKNLVTNSVVQYLTPKQSEPVMKPAIQAISSSSSRNTQTWTKTQVQEWLRDNHIDEKIQTTLIDFTGEMIQELNNIRNTASEYFFNSISQQNTVQLNEVVKFSNVLRKLTF